MRIPCYRGVAALVISVAYMSPSPPSRAATSGTITIYVSPSGTDAGSGSSNDPFVLTAGREYELNRLIQPILNSGTPVEVLFHDGTYQDVRLQIIRQGIDTSTIYMLQSSSTPGGAPTTYHLGATCNNQGNNCRVMPQDFTMGRNTTTPLVLQAEHPGDVIFDGSGTRDLRPAIDSNALMISGSIFGGPPATPYTVQSGLISNVTVQGLTFRNYRDGIHVQYGTHVAIENCRLTSIGNRIPRQSDADPFGTFALRIDGASHLVLATGNTISRVWNAGGNGVYASGNDDPSLMHSIYDGYSYDVIFLNNTLVGSSAPMIKFGFYPITTDGVTYFYPTATSDRRHFFIGNSFTLDTVHDGPDATAATQVGQAFIHDNSREEAAGEESAPAAGIVFLSNRFFSQLPNAGGLPVALLRQELPSEADKPSFPEWTFEGNASSGLDPDYLLIARNRGAVLEPSGFDYGSEEQAIALQLALPQQNAPGEDVLLNWAPVLDSLIQTTLKSSNAEEDTLVLWIAKHGTMPSTD